MFWIKFISLRGFNPRAREGRDSDQRLVLDGADVSIHAPVKDATPLKPPWMPCKRFQSTRP